MYKYRRIYDLRRDSDYTQAVVAAVLGITSQQYSLYERGEREIPVHHLIRLADYYQVSVDYLLGRTDVKDLPKG